MTATLQDTESAIWRALAGLVPGYTIDVSTATAPSIAGTAAPSDTQPVRLLQRYAGEVTQAFAELAERGLAQFDATKLPALFLACAGGRPLGTDGAHVEGGGHTFTAVMRTRWVVYVIVGDLRGDAQATVAAIAGQPAALSVTQRVLVTLAGLQIDGLHDGKPLMVDGFEPWVIAKRVAYIYALHLHADLELPGEVIDSQADAPGVPLAGVRGYVDDASPDTDATTVTLSSFESLPSD